MRHKLSFQRPSLAMAVVMVFVGLSAVGRAANLPKYDHVIIIFEENKDYGQIIGSANAPYINNTLLGTYGGALFTNMHAETHPSQPNYIDFFSGSNQGVTDDGQYDLPGTILPAHHHAQPGRVAAGQRIHFQGLRGRSALGRLHRRQQRQRLCAETLPLGQLAAVPRGKHLPSELHSGQPQRPVLHADRQHPQILLVLLLSDRLLPIADRLLRHSESEERNAQRPQHRSGSKRATHGFKPIWMATSNGRGATTASCSSRGTRTAQDGQTNNQLIPTILVGAHLKAGSYSEAINHYNLLRTLEDMYQLPYCTSADSGAVPITDVFTSVPEPSTLVLLGLGALALLACAWRRRHR